MPENQSSQDPTGQFGRTFEIAMRLALAFLLVGLCIKVFLPFALPVAWAAIIAVGGYPGYLQLRKLTGGRGKIAAALFVIVALVVILVPTSMLAETLIGSATQVARQLEANTLEVPPPPANVAGWPVVGKPIHDFWSLASSNLASAVEKLGPQLAAAAGVLLGAAADVGLMVVQFIIACVIAGVMLARSEGCKRGVYTVAMRLAGEKGQEYAELAGATVRNVARGILGVAVIQALAAGIGFLAIGLPAAGLWALFCLILAVIQLGPGLVIIPAVIYVFSSASTVPAVLFLVWNILVVTSDNVLKPMLMGRGSKVPIIIIFIGALGGFISMGIIGLFIGSVILSLGYQLFRVWLASGDEAAAGDA